MQEGLRPRSFYAERPGRWVAEPAWPSPNVERRRLPLARDGLGGSDDGREARQVTSPQDLGLWSGEYMPMFGLGPAPELPGDQRPEDAGSLLFDSDPQDEALELLGDPRAHLRLTCDQPLGLVAVRLCDVAPDGASSLITRGILNLAQREGREVPRAMTPGTPTRSSMTN